VLLHPNQDQNNYVMRLYWSDNSRTDELKIRYGRLKGVQYRYWKSDEDTRKGKYSEQYKNNF
jgi:hypothetical protein